MADLIAISFKDPAKAFDMRARLAELQKEYLITMEDVTVVTRDDDGKGLCCTKPLMSEIPLSPDGFIPRFL